MWVELAVYGGLLGASYVYHRWIAPKPQAPPKPASEIQIPKIDEGAHAPLVYGRCRVRQPVLIWTSDFSIDENAGPPTETSYQMDMALVLGIPFENTLSKLWSVWVGDHKLGQLPWGGNDSVNGTSPHDGTLPNAASPTKAGRFNNTVAPNNTSREVGLMGGYVQFYDGRATQRHALHPGGAISHLGQAMLDEGVASTAIAGLRGYLSIVHFHESSIGKWQLGAFPQLGALSYEVSSYPNNSTAYNIGLETNPARVLEDILTAKLGKLALPASLVDFDSFDAAAIRLQEEGNGYSRAIEAGVDALEVIREVLVQIDGVLYVDPSDGKIHLKLVRPDYDPSTLIEITTSNCERLENFSAGGWDGVKNKVRVVYSDRNRDYQESSATAHNQASAVVQVGGTDELVLRMLGVCTRELAQQIAARELSARSRPLAKCSAIVDRSFYTTVPGDPVKLTWPEYGIDGRVFRVAAVDRGTLENGKIALDLIEDFHFVWRNRLPTGPIHDYPLEPF